jgi:outer membrane cobalamin receptor
MIIQGNTMTKITLLLACLSQIFIIHAFAAENIKTKTVEVTSRRTLENIQNIQANIQVISRENIQELKPNSTNSQSIRRTYNNWNIIGAA